MTKDGPDSVGMEMEAGKGQDDKVGIVSDEEAARLWSTFMNAAEPRGWVDFDRLYEHFVPVVYRYCRYRLRDHHWAEDVANTVFVRLLEQHSRGAAPVLRGSFVGFVLAIARNLCTTELSRKTRASDVDQMLVSHQESPAELIERQEELDALDVCLSRLSKAEHELLYLRYRERLTLRAIGQVVGRVESTVNRRLEKSLAKLRRCLDEKI